MKHDRECKEIPSIYVEDRGKVISIMEKSNIVDFMSIWCMSDIVMEKTFCQRLASYLSTDIVMRNDGFRIVMSNKQCKIDGYSESSKVERF